MSPQDQTRWATTGEGENQGCGKKEKWKRWSVGQAHYQINGVRTFHRKPTGVNFKKGAKLKCIRQKYFHGLGTEGLRTGRAGLS